MHDEHAKSRKTEWTPKEGDEHHGTYATEVMHGVQGVATVRNHRKKRRTISADEAVEGVLAGDRTTLARAITLVESKAEAHRETAREILRRCLPHAGNSVRLGITGTPGAGKSTFIECLGMQICEKGGKIAVLAVDPTSSRSGGSVLGDKTRMEKLTREANAFIRPSPAGEALGGVAAKTREAMLLCEAAGFDNIIVETVGVGQSEVAVRTMVDFFLLLQIAGGGDDLQGIKKGVIEMADAIAVNKADGDNINKANLACGEYKRVMHYLKPYTDGWAPQALTCSAATGAGVDDVWAMVVRFCEELKAQEKFAAIRSEQNRQWLKALVRDAVLLRFYKSPHVVAKLPQIEQDVSHGVLPVVEAVEILLGE
ncbi:methylmalonyl Co-A mutase-associated GTPase MeaB [Cerasicoccus frondis]|uniref:methylmalonyl Co-A mutase-associated GTPase MeaB n=1 Tax=Cerasicoccus frondis TaxID=490090 RepID=UPI002852673B|nr:methylmalonyl Co-A mutase-associated GTPase MeaB [Cerasicoccus frondis]